MKKIKRDYYLQKLVESQNDGFPKVITGIRRCGKSFLLNVLYRNYLLEKGVPSSSILFIDLNLVENAYLRNPFSLLDYVKKKSKGKKSFFVFIDEIQNVYSVVNPSLTGGKRIVAGKRDTEIVSFVDAVLSIASLPGVDLYITGSNSKRLSSDVVTQFRDKAKNIHLQPLSFSEYFSFVGGSSSEALNDYLVYGGRPRAVFLDNTQKEKYLEQLFERTYFRDIVERHNIKKTERLDSICNVLSESCGGLMNSIKLSNSFKNLSKETISPVTINSYIKMFEDSYIIEEARRFDLRGRKEIGALRKYYFTDIGLRNARLNFAFPDLGLCLENVIYNELIYHGFSVNVGVFDYFSKNKKGVSVRKNGEVDFYAKKGLERYYIQVCQDISNPKTHTREVGPYRYLNDQVKKIVVTNSPLQECLDVDGYTIIGATDFLLRFLNR